MNEALPTSVYPPPPPPNRGCMPHRNLRSMILHSKLKVRKSGPSCTHTLSNQKPKIPEDPHRSEVSIRWRAVGQYRTTCRLRLWRPRHWHRVFLGLADEAGAAAAAVGGRETAVSVVALIVSLVRVVAAVAWLMVAASVVVVVGIVGIALHCVLWRGDPQPQPNIFQRPEEAHPIVWGLQYGVGDEMGSLESRGWCV